MPKVVYYVENEESNTLTHYGRTGLTLNKNKRKNSTVRKKAVDNYVENAVDIGKQFVERYKGG